MFIGKKPRPETQQEFLRRMNDAVAAGKGSLTACAILGGVTSAKSPRKERLQSLSEIEGDETRDD